MSWEMPVQYQDYLIPSLVLHTHLKAEERTCLQREIAMDLLRAQRINDEDFNEEDFEGWDLMPLLEEIASRVDSMSNGGFFFEIDKGGWTMVRVCSYEEMIDWFES